MKATNPIFYGTVCVVKAQANGCPFAGYLAGAAGGICGCAGSGDGSGANNPNVTSTGAWPGASGGAGTWILPYATVNGTQWADNNAGSVRTYSGALVPGAAFAQNARETAGSTLGAAATTSSPHVSYAYAADANPNAANERAHGLRLESVAYPNGRVLHYDYGTSGGADDNLNRVRNLIDNDGTSVLAAYSYLGLATAVIVDYQEPDVKLDDFGGTSGTYNGLDRFNRVVDQLWIDYQPDPDVPLDRIKYGYDRAER